MDLTLSLQDDPDSTIDDATRHRKELGIPEKSNADEREVTGGGKMSLSSSYGHLNPTVYDPTTELTEDDIFRMKNIRLSNLASEAGEQENCSAISVIDSASNFDERLGASAEGTDDEDEEEEDANSTEENADLILSDIEQHSISSKSIGDFVFGRNRGENLELNRNTVTELRYPFVPAITPGDSDAQAYANAFISARVFLVGTAHFSTESQNDVRKTIAATQPDLIMLELCSSRIAILSMDEELLLREAKKLNYNSMRAIIQQSGIVQGVMHILLLSISANITRQLGMAPGSEFRAAHAASKDVPGCHIVLGDRPLQITLQRALSSLSFFQKIRLFFRMLASIYVPITQEDVERCKDKDLLEELLKEMAGQFPQLTKILVKERDLYMVHMLHKLVCNTTIAKWNASKHGKVLFEPVNVVAVVGIGHVGGIVENWNNHVDCDELLTVPEPSKTSKAIRLAFKAMLLGAFTYGAYRVVRKATVICPRITLFRK